MPKPISTLKFSINALQKQLKYNLMHTEDTKIISSSTWRASKPNKHDEANTENLIHTISSNSIRAINFEPQLTYEAQKQQVGDDLMHKMDR